MATVKIKQPAGPSRTIAGTIAGTSILVDGRQISGVRSLDLSMSVDMNTLRLEQVVVLDVEIEADVDITQVCSCCGHPLVAPAL